MLKLQDQAKRGAGWFYWIAALSIINSIALLFTLEWSFVVGLGVTQVLTAIGMALAEEVGEGVRYVVFGLEVVVALVFVVFGYFAARRGRWAFIVGMILYGFDAFVLGVFQDWLGLGFHVFALWFINAGLAADKKLRQMQAGGFTPNPLQR